MADPLLEEHLPCGVSTEELFATVLDGDPPPDPDHAAGCPHCRAALAELRIVWDRFQEVAAIPVRMRPGLLDEVMERVRQLLVTSWVVTESPTGYTVVTEQLLTNLVAGAVRRSGGVVAVEASRVERAADAKRLQIEVEIVATTGVVLPELAAQLRHTIAGQLERVADMRVERIDVTIVDLEP